jgi:hypothetical protein
MMGANSIGMFFPFFIPHMQFLELWEPVICVTVYFLLRFNCMCCGQ